MNFDAPPELAAPAALEHDAIKLHVGIDALDGLGTPAAHSTETSHPFHVKAATETVVKLPPIGA